MSPSFKRLLIGAFFVGAGASQLALLAVAWRNHGMTTAEIANIATAYVIGITLGDFISGPLAQRVGAVRTLLIGGIVFTAGVAGFYFVLGSVILTAFASFVRGLGSGLYQPGGQMF